MATRVWNANTGEYQTRVSKKELQQKVASGEIEEVVNVSNVTASGEGATRSYRYPQPVNTIQPSNTSTNPTSVPGFTSNNPNLNTNPNFPIGFSSNTISSTSNSNLAPKTTYQKVDSVIGGILPGGVKPADTWVGSVNRKVSEVTSPLAMSGTIQGLQESPTGQFLEKVGQFGNIMPKENQEAWKVQHATNPVEQVGYGIIQGAYENVRTKPVENVAMFGVGAGFRVAGAGLGLVGSKLITTSPTIVRAGQIGVTAIGTGLLAIPAVQSYNKIKEGDYYGGGRIIGETGEYLAVGVAGAKVAGGIGVVKNWEGSTLINQQRNIYTAEQRGFSQGGTKAEIASNINAQTRQLEPSLFKWATGRTDYTYQSVTTGEVTNIVRSPRPAIFPDTIVTYKFKPGSSRGEVQPLQFGDLSPKTSEIITPGLTTARSNAFESAVALQKVAWKTPVETKGSIDFQNTESFKSLSPELQKAIINRISLNNDVVFGGTSSGKPGTSDIDLFSNTGRDYSIIASKSGASVTTSIQASGSAGGSEVVTINGVKTFDIHPFSQYSAFPYRQKFIDDKSTGVLKTTQTEELSRRVFGSVESTERFSKDVPEMIRLGQAKGLDTSQVSSTFTAVNNEVFLNQLSNPTPSFSLIVGSIVAMPSFVNPTSNIFPSTPTSAIVRSIVASPPSKPYSYLKPSSPSSSSPIRSPSTSTPSGSPSISPPSNPYKYKSPGSSVSPSSSSSSSSSSTSSPPEWIGNTLPIPLFALGGFSEGLGSNIIAGGKRKTAYTPSFSALVFKKFGTYKAGKLAKTGLDYRPITKKWANSISKSRGFM